MMTNISCWTGFVLTGRLPLEWDLHWGLSSFSRFAEPFRLEEIPTRSLTALWIPAEVLSSASAHTDKVYVKNGSDSENHNLVSSAVFNIYTVCYSTTNHAYSFRHVVWQNCAIGTPGKVEINIFCAYIFKVQNHWIWSCWQTFPFHFQLKF